MSSPPRDLLTLLGEAAIDQPNPTPALKRAARAYLRIRERHRVSTVTTAASLLGRRGGVRSGEERAKRFPPERRLEIGRKGAATRMARLSPERRKEIARVALLARWEGHTPKQKSIDPERRRRALKVSPDRRREIGRMGAAVRWEGHTPKERKP